MADFRFPSPGTDVRYPSPGLDIEHGVFPIDGRWPDLLIDARFDGGYGGGVEELIAPSNTSLPVVSGTAEVGELLTCSPGTWLGSPTPRFTYQWKRNGVAIAGEVLGYYRTVTADAGTSISCAVTGLNAAGKATATSNSLSVVTGTAGVPNQTFIWGEDTLAASGDYQILTKGGLVISACTITGGTLSSRFQVSSAGVLKKAAADNAVMPSGTVVVLVNGTYSATLTTQIEANAFSAAGILQFEAAFESATISYGDRILMRPGDINQARADIRLGRTTSALGNPLPTGSFEHAGVGNDAPPIDDVNWIVVEPESPSAVVRWWYVTLANYGVDPYLHFKNPILCQKSHSVFGDSQIGALNCITAVGFIKVSGLRSYMEGAPLTPSQRMSTGWGISFNRTPGNGHIRIEDSIFVDMSLSMYLTGPNCRVIGNYIEGNVADYFDTTGNISGLICKWNEFGPFGDGYYSAPILSIERNASYTRVFVGTVAATAVGGSDWVMVTGLDVGTGCAELDARTANTEGVTSVQFTRDTVAGWIQFNALDSSGFSAHISGGTLRWSNAHQDGYQQILAPTLGWYDNTEWGPNLWHGMPNADKYAGYGVNSMNYHQSANPQWRYTRMRGQTGIQRSTNQAYLGAHQDADIAFCTFLRPLADNFNPENALNIGFTPSGTTTVKYCVSNIAIAGADDTCIVIPDRSSPAYAAAFTDPRRHDDPLFKIHGYGMKPGGTLSAAYTGKPYNAGALGTGYVDWVNRVTHFPDEIPAVPAVFTAPSISGTPTVGGTLTCNPGVWTGYPDPTFTYQWKRNGADIGGATATTYITSAPDTGTTVTCVVLATNTEGSSSATTAGVSVTGVSYEAETLAIFAAFPTPAVSVDYKLAINAFVVALKAAGVWAKLDTLYCLAGEALDHRPVNWINPGTFDLQTLGANNQWTKFRHSYISPLAAENGLFMNGYKGGFGGANKFKQNDSSFFCVVTSRAANSNYWEMGNIHNRIRSMGTVGSNAQYNVGTTSSRFPAGPGTGLGFMCATRDTSTTAHMHYGDMGSGSLTTLDDATSYSSIAPTDCEFMIFNINVGVATRDTDNFAYSSSRIPVVGCGSFLTPTQASDLYVATNAFVDAIQILT